MNVMLDIPSDHMYRFIASDVFNVDAAYCPEPKLYASSVEVGKSNNIELTSKYSELVSTQNQDVWIKSLITKEEFEHARWDSSLHGTVKRILNFFGNRLMEAVLANHSKRIRLDEHQLDRIKNDMQNLNEVFSIMMKNDKGISEVMDLILTRMIFERSRPKIRHTLAEAFDEKEHLKKIVKETGEKDISKYYWKINEVLDKVATKTTAQIETIYQIMLVAGHTPIPFFGTKFMKEEMGNHNSKYNFKNRFSVVLDLLKDYNFKFSGLDPRNFTKLLLEGFEEKIESFWEYSAYLRNVPRRTLYTKSKYAMPLSWIFATFSVNRSWPETKNMFKKNYASIIGQYPYLSMWRRNEAICLGVTINHRAKNFGVFILQNLPQPPKGDDKKSETILTEFFLWYARMQFLKGVDLEKIENPLHRFSNVSRNYARRLDRTYLERN